MRSEAIVDFPLPLAPTSETMPLSAISIEISFSTLWLSSYAKLRFSTLIDPFSGRLIVFSSGTSRSKILKILSIAAIPFIAIWKKLPSCLIGIKKSAESSIIAIACSSLMFPATNCLTVKIMPKAAPPYATKSIIVMELSCIVRTFIVIFLNSSASSFIFLFLYSSA